MSGLIAFGTLALYALCIVAGAQAGGGDASSWLAAAVTMAGLFLVGLVIKVKP